MCIYVYSYKSNKLFYNIQYLFPEVCPSLLQFMSFPFNVLCCIWMTWSQLGSLNIQFTDLKTKEKLQCYYPEFKWFSESFEAISRTVTVKFT